MKSIFRKIVEVTLMSTSLGGLTMVITFLLTHDPSLLSLTGFAGAWLSGSLLGLKLFV